MVTDSQGDRRMLPEECQPRHHHADDPVLVNPHLWAFDDVRRCSWEQARCSLPVGAFGDLSSIDTDRLASDMACRVTAEENDERRYVLGEPESPERGFLDHQIPDQHRCVLL